MKEIYAYFGTSKQAVSQAHARMEQMLYLQTALHELVTEIRDEHPRMGLRKIYVMLLPLPIGRDRFEHLMMELRLFVKRAHPRWITTLTQYLLRFPNLIAGITITGPHQIWVSDITYFELQHRFAYIVIIEDVYTRRVLAAVASTSLRAESNIEALTIALAATKEERRGIRTIHHSDRGSQYIDRAYLALLAHEHIRPSMCEAAYENAYAERVIGTMKNEYLHHRGITTIEQLHDELQRTIILYNAQRPHQSLPHMMTPDAFMAYVKKLPEKERPPLTIYDSRKDKNPAHATGPEGSRQEEPKPGIRMALDDCLPGPGMNTKSLSSATSSHRPIL